MDKNAWFNINESYIEAKVEKKLIEWRKTHVDVSCSNYNGFGSLDKYIEHQKSIIRRSIITTMNEMELLSRHSELDNKLNKIEKMLEKIIDIVDKQNHTCDRMNNHISFVENTYETLRSPLDYLSGQVNRLRGVESSRELPKLQ